MQDAGRLDPDADAGVEIGFVNMNDDEDADIFLDAGIASRADRPAGISVYGRNGGDTLQGQGTKGTGGTGHRRPVPEPATPATTR